MSGKTGVIKSSLEASTTDRSWTSTTVDRVAVAVSNGYENKGFTKPSKRNKFYNASGDISPKVFLSAALNALNTSSPSITDIVSTVS